MTTGPTLYGVKIIGIGKAEIPPGWFKDNHQIAADLRAQREIDAHILKRELTPDELKRYETDDDWIKQRIQISTRPIVPENIATSDLAAQAAINAMRYAGITPEQINGIRLATVTPDELASPSCVMRIAHSIGIPLWDVEGSLPHELIACDQALACSSFLAALQDGYSDCALGFSEYELVIGADKMSSINDSHGRDFFPILSGHGAAILLKRVPFEESDFFANGFYAGGDGSKAFRIIAEAGGSRLPISTDYIASDPLLRKTKLQMDGNEVFKELVGMLNRFVIPEAIEKANLTPRCIAAVVPHQANGRMIEAFDDKLRKLGFSGYMSKTIGMYGNSTSASVPLGIIDVAENAKLKNGDIVMLVTMGGGYSWRIIFIRWSLS